MLMRPEAVQSLPTPTSPLLTGFSPLPTGVSPLPTGFSPLHLDPHDAPLESAFASGIELLGLQRALDRLHRVVYRVQVARAPARRVDRLVAAKLQPVLEPPKHVHGVGEPSMRPEGDTCGLEPGGLPAVRVRIGERDAGRRRGPVGERLLAHRGERVELGKLVTGNDGRGRAGVGACVGHVGSSLRREGMPDRPRAWPNRGRTYVIWVTTPELRRAASAPRWHRSQGDRPTALGCKRRWLRDEPRPGAVTHLPRLCCYCVEVTRS